MPRRTRQHHAGFTIIELLVSFGVLGLMLFLINELFQDTSAAVTRSVQTSKVIATTRIINEQLNTDTDAMQPPKAGANDVGGYLMIIQRRLTDVTMLDPQTLAEVTVSEIRSDQLVFIRNASGLGSMTPQGADNYRTTLEGGPGGYAKVYYGHAQRTLPNGQRAGTTGQYALGGANAGLDRIASNWVFARQAMLFNPPGLNPASNTHAATAAFNSPVNNVAGFGGPNAAYMGLTDVIAQPYGPASDPTSLLYQLTDASILPFPQRDNYLNTTYYSAINPLHVNTSPDPTQTGYASWAIAQGHPILAQGCSDIIIDFAADLNGNGRIDTEFGGGNDTSGQIWWYDGIRQPFLGDSANNGTWEQQASVQQPLINNSGANLKIIVFRAEDDDPYDPTGAAIQAHSYWPYLVRVRYRLHDTRGRLTSNNPVALIDGIDNDGDGTVDNDEEDRISGRWFEHIIKVQRD